MDKKEKTEVEDYGQVEFLRLHPDLRKKLLNGNWHVAPEPEDEKEFLHGNVARPKR